jgi:hypothetical protein
MCAKRLGPNLIPPSGLSLNKTEGTGGGDMKAKRNPFETLLIGCQNDETPKTEVGRVIKESLSFILAVI